MTNWNDKEMKNSALKRVFLTITALVLALQVFGVPGVKIADKELTSYEKAMAALPGWVSINGNPISSYECNLSNNPGISSLPSIFVCQTTNYPSLAWQDSTTSNGITDIFFCKWNGVNWVNINNIDISPSNCNVSINTSESSCPSLALDKQGNPAIAWQDKNSGNFDIFYVKWDGSNWINISGFLYNGSNANITNNTSSSIRPSLVLDDKNYPSISWRDFTSSGEEIFFIYWDGKDWRNHSKNVFNKTNANITNNYGNLYDGPLLLINPVTKEKSVVWHVDIGGCRMCFAKYNGSSWVNVSGSTLTKDNCIVTKASGGIRWDPKLAFDMNGIPFIAWRQRVNSYDIFCAKWSGSYWTNMNGENLDSLNGVVINTTGDSLWPSIIIDKSNNLCIAWSEVMINGKKDIYFAKWNGVSWVNDKDNILTNENGNVSNNGGDSTYPSLGLGSLGELFLTWDDSTPGNYEIYLAKCNGSSQPANGIKEFIKEVDTNADGIFDDNNKPVKPGQTISYRIKLGFEKGMKSSAWVVDKIPYEATYVRGCQPSNQVYYSFPAKNWTFKANVSGEPQENADKGTFIIWKADPANGENQTFMFKVKAATQSQMPMSLKTNGLMSPANAVSTYSGVKSEPAGLFVPDLSSTMFTNSAYNGFEASEEKLDILDPIESEEWPISTGVRVQWNYTGNAINKDTGLRKSITFEVKTSLGQIISKRSFDIFENNMVATLPLTYSNWDEIVARSKNTSATLTAFIDGKKAKSVNITLARHGVLNYASWADSNSTIKGRHPLIFVHGVNLMSQTSSESEELAFDTLLKSFGNEQNNLFKYFKPYVFHYDSGDLLDSFCDYETPVSYSDPPGAGKTLKGVEAVGFELKKSIESAYNTEPSTFNNMNGMYFVCHSMGGLVTRSFMAEKWNDKDRYFGQDVTRVVTLGTPHHGSPAASLSIGAKNILASQFSTDLSWDDYDISLEDEKSPNMFLKRLNCIPTYIGKSWWVQQSEPTTDCKVDYSYKIVALAGQIAIKNSDGKAWIDDTNNAILGVGHTVSSYLKNLGDIGVITSSFLLPIIGIISFISNPAISVITKKWSDNVFELTLKTKNGSEEKIAVKDLKPFNKNYVQNDGIVPVESALYTDSLNELYNKQLFESKWSPYPIYYNHFTICTEPDVVAFVAHSICSPILKVSPAVIKPGDYFTIEGKSFGAQRWDSNIFLGKTRSVANPNPVIMTNVQLPTELPIKVISWSNEKIVCQMPSDVTMTNASTMINSSALGDNYQLYLRTGINGIISPITPVNEENPETGTPSWDGKVIVKTKEDRVSLSVWPSKSQLVKGEDVEFTIKAKNTGTSELTNVDITSNIPRELEFVSSTIKGVMGKNKLRIQLDRLMPNETTLFKVVCRLDENINIPEESGLWLLYSANLSSGNNISTSASALVEYYTRKPTENLSMNIIWKGVNTKTNEAKVGNPVTLTIDVNGGSMPYHLTIDWGDGNEKEKKTWNKMFDPKPVFVKTYDNPAEVQVSITCVDAYGKTTSIQRIIQIKKYL